MFLKIPPTDADFLGYISKSHSNSLDPPPSKGQKVGEGGGIDSVILGYVASTTFEKLSIFNVQKNDIFEQKSYFLSIFCPF